MKISCIIIIFFLIIYDVGHNSSFPDFPSDAMESIQEFAQTQIQLINAEKQADIEQVNLI
jgi:hypothetical protein